MGKTIAQLRMDKKRLIKLANKQLKENRKINAAKEEMNNAKEEKRRLQAQVRTLKIRTSRTVLAKTKRIAKSIKSTATSPQTKRRLKRISGELKTGFKKFQKFADRFG